MIGRNSKYGYSCTHFYKSLYFLKGLGAYMQMSFPKPCTINPIWIKLFHGNVNIQLGWVCYPNFVSMYMCTQCWSSIYYNAYSRDNIVCICCLSYIHDEQKLSTSSHFTLTRSQLFCQIKTQTVIGQ